MEITKLVIISATLEALWESAKMLWQNGKISVDRIGALILGIFLALSSNIDFFNLLGIPLSMPYSGQILTGILISRGANFIHDFLATVEGYKNGEKG